MCVCVNIYIERESGGERERERGRESDRAHATEVFRSSVFRSVLGISEAMTPMEAVAAGHSL